MKTKLLTLIFLVVGAAAFAQAPNLTNSTKPTPVDRPLDGYYKKSNILNAKVTPYANLRELDVMFSKRVWREIDLRDKMNMVFASPKGRLIDVIMDAVMAGELTAYDATATKEDVNGDEFSTVLKPEDAMSKFADSVLVPIFDSEGNQTGTTVKPGEFNADSIVKFRIKEDWIFDKQRSVFEPRIIGIAPMMKVKAAGQVFDDQPAFWIYFPEVRQILVTKEVVNRRNDATGLSYDDVFMKRLFASYIVKESNPEDLRIKDYAQGIDKLQESERIRKELMNREHDLWSY
ncbi:gliding motility protein GldN [Flavihumibacter sp. R14]|nr:gliding motility protein GldN [Flavihumibacter soli]